MLKPKKPLADGTYKVTVTKQVTDLAGNAFDAKKKPGHPDPALVVHGLTDPLVRTRQTGGPGSLAWATAGA